jgi:hypothetical protein
VLFRSPFAPPPELVAFDQLALEFA